ncbi:MAG: hypothetical protein JWN64_697 [Parcubacteria group bacterium]|nr:hypothetical protein [Parcubacteria group bacterium]
MPDRTISILGISCGALLSVYVALVITTITFAAWQTELRASIRSTEGMISSLESEYYEHVAAITATAPSAFGLVPPASVRYAAKAPATAVSLR